jgi:hypothetical protein
MYITLNKYGGLVKLKQILHIFREHVLTNQEVKHFMYNLSLDKIFSDQTNYLKYSFPKTEQEYAKQIQQSSIEESKIPEWQFEKIVEILIKLLKSEFNILEVDQIKIAFHILELIEESRSQSNEIHTNLWKSADVSFKNIKNFFDSNGCKAKVDYERNEVRIEEGLGYPVSIKIKLKEKHLVLNSIFSFDSGLIFHEDKEVAEILSLKFNSLKYEAIQLGNSSRITSQYAIPYQNNLPTRLFIRTAKNFAEAFSGAHDFYILHSIKSLDNFKKLRQLKNETIIDKDTKSGIYKESPIELINDLNQNKVDEMVVIALFENHYNVELKIQHGDINTYLYKTKTKAYSYQFHELKELIIKKMESL